MSDTLKLRAVEKAVKFLEAAGAAYTVKLGDKEFTNKKPRNNFQQFFLPLPEAAVAEGRTEMSITVPPDVDIKNLRGALAGHLSRQYGNDSSMTEIDEPRRLIHALWVLGEKE